MAQLTLVQHLELVKEWFSEFATITDPECRHSGTLPPSEVTFPRELHTKYVLWHVLREENQDGTYGPPLGERDFLRFIYNIPRVRRVRARGTTRQAGVNVVARHLEDPPR